MERDNTSDVPANYAEQLTRSANKVSLYRDDPYFRYGHSMLPVDVALSHTFMVLKPDAIAGRRTGTVRAFLRQRGFSVVGFHRFRFSPLLTREIWRYQFNIASSARQEIVDLLLPASDSLLLVLRDDHWEAGRLPAACRLASEKGAADPRERFGPSLRSMLNSPTTLFNFVHTADEPADVVRELGLLSVATGHDITVKESQPDGLDEAVEQLHRLCREHDLDPVASRKRLGDYSAASRHIDASNMDWSTLLDCFPQRIPPQDVLWDVLSIATSEIESNVPGLVPVLRTMGAIDWRPAKETTIE